MALAGPVAAAQKPAGQLWWKGTAHLEVEGRSLDIAVDTSLEVPLLRVRSTTYILAQGPATARTLILEPDGVWVERDGKRSPMSPQLGVHERQQFAMYAWLLRVQQGKRPKPGLLALSAPPWPDIVFDIGPDGCPLAAAWTVDADAPDRPRIAERVEFFGRIDSNGVRWPTRFVMTQAGRPYFDLRISEFRAS